MSACKLLIMGVLCAGGIVPPAAAQYNGVPGPSGILGDVNGDYYVTRSDALIIRGWIGKPNFPPEMDVNGDGVVNVADFRAVQLLYTFPGGAEGP